MTALQFAVRFCLVPFLFAGVARGEPRSFAIQGELYLPADDGQQGIATDGEFFYVQITQQLRKYSLKGELIVAGPKLELHHGGATVVDGKVFVAVSGCQPEGTRQHFVHAYDARTLEFVAAHDVGEHFSVCAGGIAHRKGSFFVAESFFDNDHTDRIVEFDANFELVRVHEVDFKSPYGIQGLEYLPETDQFQVHSHGRDFYRIDARFEMESLVAGRADFDLQDVARLDAETLVINRRDTEKLVLVRSRLAEESPRIPAPAAKRRVRLAAYNVLFGNWARPERVGECLRAYDLDVIGFSEVPGDGWTERVGRAAGLEHAYVGKIASANHKDKYKSILSRTALSNPHEIKIEAGGWAPASAVGAETVVNGVSLLIYSTHIPGRPYFTDNADGSASVFLAESVLSKSPAKNLVLLGDLNNHLGDAPLAHVEKIGMRAMWRDLRIDTRRLSTHQHIESGKESGVIDHIYYRTASGARAVEGGVIYDAFNPRGENKTMERYRREWEQYGKPLSDHRPIWVVLEFPAEG